MVSMLKEIDITQVFNHFAKKKCINHRRRKGYSVCLHKDCWNSESDQAFFCGDCNVDHIKKHEKSIRFDALFTDELFDEFDDYLRNQNIEVKLKERICKFEEKINELHRDIELWIKCQFAELKRIFQSNLIGRDNFEVIKNLKNNLSNARIELSLNYEFKEKVKNYCIQVQNIQIDLNEVMNDQFLDEAKKKDEKMDEELNLKLENIKNNIQENVKNQINQLTEYIIDSNKKSESLKYKNIKEAERDVIANNDEKLDKNKFKLIEET